MRTLIYFKFFLVAITFSFGNAYDIFNQTINNYVKTRTFIKKDKLDPLKYVDCYEYFDGLGRSVQSIAVKCSPGNKNLVSNTEYDNNNHVQYTYLPYESGITDTGYRVNFKKEQTDFYLTGYTSIPVDANPYIKLEYEPSPLERLFKKYPEGAVWQQGSGRPIVYNVGSNNSPVRKWKPLDTICIPDGTYPIQSLQFESTIDEQGITTMVFRDEDNTVLKQTGSTKTFYVYDDFNRLRFVIPPQAAYLMEQKGKTIYQVDSFLFKYQYNKYNLLVARRIPGCSWEYMIYDKRDRLVLHQDGKLRQSNQWKYYKYDILNRNVIEGIYTAGNRDIMQAQVDNYTGTFFESQQANETGYNNQSFPQNVNSGTMNVITYYDNYNFADNTQKKPVLIPGSGLDTSSLLSPAGKVTGQKVRLIGGDLFLRVNFYDSLGLTLQSYIKDHFGGTDIITRNYTRMTNKPRKEHFYHSSSRGTYKMLKDYSSYDNADRISNIAYSGSNFNGFNVSYSYNNLGNLLSKSYKENGITLQRVKYSYSIRGWISGINGDDQRSSDDLFGINLLYTDGFIPVGGGASQYNGNIGAISWRYDGLGDYAPYYYGFYYDSLNRLTNAYYRETTNQYPDSYYDMYLSYDKNGNIQTLKRYWKYNNLPIVVDDLAYRHAGNRLLAVDDRVPDDANYQGFSDGATNGLNSAEYSYDPNGNMTEDKNKKLTITYNYLNLPQSVISGNNVKLLYYYNALGEKLSKEYYIFVSGQWQKYVTTDYICNMVFVNGIISEILTDEGRYVKGTDGVFMHQYFLKDHLGNIRVVFKNAGNKASLVQRMDYYPFGLTYIKTSYDGGRTQNRYLYNGKELQDEANVSLYDYGARFYDPIIARWTTIDPLAEKSQRWSPYNYAENNPIRFIDPDGKVVDDFYFNQKGELINRTKNNQPDRFFVESDAKIVKVETCNYEGSEGPTYQISEGFEQIYMNSNLGYMARTVYAESGGENKESKLAVAEVIRNRAEDKTPNSADKGWTAIFNNVSTYKEVVTQSGQFEPVQTGASRYTDPQSVTKGENGKRNEVETNRFAESIGASIKAHYQHTNAAQGALYFYSPYIKAPDWTNKLQQVIISGVSDNTFRFYKFK